MAITKRFYKGWLSFSSRSIRAYCIVLVLQLLCSSAIAVETLERIAKTGRITLGYDDSSLPFSYLDEKSQPIGYSIDVCMKIVEAVKRELRRPDLAVKFSLVSSSSSLMAVVTGDVDIECSSTTSTIYRRKQVSFTIPMFFAKTTFMVREGSGIRTFNDMYGKTVVATKGGNNEELFDEYHDRLSAKLVLAKSDTESLAMLESGAADALISDDVRLRRLQLFAKEPGKFKIMQYALNVEPLSIVLSKDDSSFKRLVDAEMARVITQGELRSIHQKWFQSPIPPQQINLNIPMGNLLLDSLRTPSDWVQK